LQALLLAGDPGAVAQGKPAGDGPGDAQAGMEIRVSGGHGLVEDALRKGQQLPWVISGGL